MVVAASATVTNGAGVEAAGEVVAVVAVLPFLLLSPTSTRSTAVLVLVVVPFAPLLAVMLSVTPVPGSASSWHNLQVDSYREEQRRLVWLCAAV